MFDFYGSFPKFVSAFTGIFFLIIPCWALAASLSAGDSFECFDGRNMTTSANPTNYLALNLCFSIMLTLSIIITVYVPSISKWFHILMFQAWWIFAIVFAYLYTEWYYKVCYYSKPRFFGSVLDGMLLWNFGILIIGPSCYFAPFLDHYISMLKERKNVSNHEKSHTRMHGCNLPVSTVQDIVSS